VTDAAMGERIADLPIGQHPDAADFDGQAGRIFVSNGGGNGTLTVVHEDDPDHYSVEDTVQTGTGAKTMAFDRTSKRVYLPASVDGSFTVLVGALR
jgi:DNA-binding beta-propeller fold protein YncE